MPIEQQLNERLKRMWRIQEAFNNGKEVSVGDKAFFNMHLTETRTYYEQNAEYWRTRAPFGSE